MIPVPTPLACGFKNIRTRYPRVSIYNIHFLPIAGFIRGYPRVLFFIYIYIFFKLYLYIIYIKFILWKIIIQNKIKIK